MYLRGQFVRGLLQIRDQDDLHAGREGGVSPGLRIFQNQALPWQNAHTLSGQQKDTGTWDSPPRTFA